ncbi:MAG: NUDIX domain-containing protein [Salinigranum sp.]
MAHVVTCFLRNRGEVLLVRRSDAVGTYAGRWGGVSGYVEGDPADALVDARREIREETGLEAASPVRIGDVLDLVDGDREWTVHPFLFDVDRRGVTPNEELATWEWTSPTAMFDRETVPGLWEAYRRVGPTAATVREDRERGSAAVSVSALEALRDAAAVADDWEAIADVACDLRSARPSMAAVANRVNRAMAAAARDPRAIHDAASAAIERALDADDAAAANAAELLSGTAATLSRSGTVLAALEAAEVDVLVAESRPAREGVGVAERLADAGAAVTLTTDAAMAHLLGQGAADVALVGADAVLADGSVANKVGTRALGLAADREGVPLYVVAARDKIRPDERMAGESGDSTDVYDGEANLEVANPIFDRTPADLVTGVVTEEGVLDAGGVREAAAEHRELARWDDA